jgi:hypothetical protein
MWCIVDKRNDVVVGSYPTRAEARWAKKYYTVNSGKHYRLENL